jgi:hypothetical protein
VLGELYDLAVWISDGFVADPGYGPDLLNTVEDLLPALKDWWATAAEGAIQK